MKRHLIGCLLLAAMHLCSHAHDAIDAESRKVYLQKLGSLQRTAQSAAPPAERAAALVETGRTLDEIRSLLNEDIISHGRTQGLETSILVDQLSAGPHRMLLSPQSGLYLANNRPYQDALALAPRSPAAPLARYMLMKNQFYDSFVDDPLKPIAQDKATLLEMIRFGDALRASRDPAIDPEEVHFILGLNYLRARLSGALPVADSDRRFADLLKIFRARWPSSLKLATLEALAPQ